MNVSRSERVLNIRTPRRVRGTPLVLSPEEAMGLIDSGDTLAIGGSGGGLLEPDLLLKALGNLFQATSEPKDLTVLHTTGIGDRAGSGMDYLAYKGLARRIIGGNWGMAPRMSELVVEEAFEAYNYPQGVMSQLFREIAGGRLGVFTKVGLGTFIDPRLEGGRLNSSAKEDLVKVLTIANEEILFYPAMPIDVCFIRGTTADEVGNISLEQEAAKLDSLSIAQATRNSGGLVIVQVKQLALAGSIKAREVVIPGFLVDVIVINPEQKQLVTDSFNPAYSGDLKIPLGRMDFLPQGQRKIVARRALYEIADDDVVNLGVGIADGIALTASEENWSEKFVLTIEQGIVGGVPARGVIFGASINPTAIIDQAAQFDFYDGGGLDIAFLGFAQVDLKGNVNVSKFGGRIIGTGGFVNISQNASTVVFCGTFTAGGLEATPLDGILNIVQEGAVRKFVCEVEQITFSGEVASKNGQRVLYITERAVLRLIDDGLELIEYAPGIDVQKDILDLIDGEIKISHNLKVMDSKIFLDDLLGDSWRAGDKVRRDHK